MDKVTLVKNQMRARNWQELIQARQDSGQTVVSWCRENNVNIKTYYYWLRKLRQQEIVKQELPVPVEAPEKPVVFKQLEVHTPVVGIQAAVIIRLPSATVEVTEGTSQATIEAVLLALRCLC